MVLLLVLACSPPDGLTAPVAFDNPDDIAAIPERTHVDIVGEARLSPDGMAFRQPDDEGSDRWLPTIRGSLPVAQIGDTLGVVWEDYNARMVVHVERIDLRPVVVEPIWAEGVWFPAGFDGVVHRDDGLWLSHRGHRAVIEVPTPDWTVDHFWVNAEVARPEAPEERSAILLYEETELYDGPDGTSIGHTKGQQLNVSRLSEQGDFVEVWFTDHPVTIQAWVAASDIVPPGHGVMWGGCWGHGSSGWGGHGWSHGSKNVLKGDRLYDGPEGPEIGIAKRDMYLSPQDEDGDWFAVELATPWGYAEVWIDPLAR